MTVSDTTSVATGFVGDQASLVTSSIDMRDKFKKWLTDGSKRKYFPETAELIVARVDRESEYAVHKKIAVASLWEYTNSRAFTIVYKRLLEARLQHVTRRNERKELIVVGNLYHLFLKENSVNREKQISFVKEKTFQAIIEQLTAVLSKHFTNGYRLNSPIEIARFRSFLAKSFDDDLILTDNELITYIKKSGTVFDGKVYVVSQDAKERIVRIAEEYFANGTQAIFFAEFYARNEEWLFEKNVVSEDMLVVVLRMLFPDMFFTQTYFGNTNASVSVVLENEILRIWNGDILLTYNQLVERLQYIPLDRIKYALAQNGDFIWNSVETFSHISRIEITDEECHTIRATTVQECSARGYVSISNLPLCDIERRNCELSITAIHNSVYRICLSDQFDKKGKIITRKGDVFDAITIMKEYCMTIDKCTLDALLKYEKELTGEIHRWIPMEAGYAVLVRIDKENYVADRYVCFDVDLSDEAIELFVKDEYRSLKSFTTFAPFPDCGQAWNLFLLESYCRRFSRKFRFDSLSVNSKNIGTVVRKSCNLNYIEIMLDAVRNAGIRLERDSTVKFLLDNGYIARNTDTVFDKIVSKAKSYKGEFGNARN